MIFFFDSDWGSMRDIEDRLEMLIFRGKAQALITWRFMPSAPRDTVPVYVMCCATSSDTLKLDPSSQNAGLQTRAIP
jgi:hypothetical protein